MANIKEVACEKNNIYFKGKNFFFEVSAQKHDQNVKIHLRGGENEGHVHPTVVTL